MQKNIAAKAHKFQSNIVWCYEQITCKNKKKSYLWENSLVIYQWLVSSCLMRNHVTNKRCMINTSLIRSCMMVNEFFFPWSKVLTKFYLPIFSILFTFVMSDQVAIICVHSWDLYLTFCQCMHDCKACITLTYFLFGEGVNFFNFAQC